MAAYYLFIRLTYDHTLLLCKKKKKKKKKLIQEIHDSKLKFL